MADMLAAPPPPGLLSGAAILATALQQQGVKYMFGIVGIPVVEVGAACQMAGIRYYGFRNEQAASLAAGAASYLDGSPQACLAVSGPGVINCVSGLANAWANAWPMILIGGSFANAQQSMGAFQESPQLDACRPFTKYQVRVDSAARIPFYIARAIHISKSGRPGPVYIELPAELIADVVEEKEVDFGFTIPKLPKAVPLKQDMLSALHMIQASSRPLLIIGKGAAWSRAEHSLLQFVQATHIPFLATPMGKGVVADDHANSVAAARSYALGQADLIILCGARFNWILHFGQTPRYQPNIKVIQLDIQCEEFHTNKQTNVPLLGDIQATVQCMNELITSERISFPDWKPWKAALQKEVSKNLSTLQRLMSNDSVPLSYYRVFKGIAACLPRDCMIVSEGANTMDIGRTILGNYYPRHRLDAGTYGTMGVGLGFAIAAAAYYAQHDPKKRIVCIEGDSAFGFSGMEYETAVRYQLPIVFIVVNNSGIYQGIEADALPADRYSLEMPVTQLTLWTHYEKMADMTPKEGSRGFLVTKPEEIEPAVKTALSFNHPSIINIFIQNTQQRKEQPHGWLTRAEKPSKL